MSRVALSKRAQLKTCGSLKPEGNLETNAKSMCVEFTKQSLPSQMTPTMQSRAGRDRWIMQTNMLRTPTVKQARKSMKIVKVPTSALTQHYSGSPKIILVFV